MTDTALTPGTEIEVHGLDMAFNDTWEPAVIGRWNTKISGPRDAVPGYHTVIFRDGGKLLVHESSFRIKEAAR